MRGLYKRCYNRLLAASCRQMAALRRKLEQLGWDMRRREEVCLPQALSALCCAFWARLEQELRAERQKAARAEKTHQRTREDLALAHAEVLRLRARLGEQ